MSSPTDAASPAVNDAGVAPTAGAPTAGAPITPIIPQRVAALYVGDLSTKVTESGLYELFKQAGAVQSIRICRDAVTRQSLRYGYVNFQNTDDAERALDTLNYTRLEGRPIRISWSQRDPAKRRSNVGNTFIKNLDSGIDSLALEEVFSAFGNIVSCKVQTNDDGESLGYGFVQFETDEIAKKAIESMNSKCLNEKKIFIGPFIPRKLRQPVNSASVFTNLYVKELPADTTEESFQALFAPFGTITSLKLMPNDGRPFGFVNFQDHDMAVKAVEEMDGKDLGKTLYVARAQSKRERQDLLAKRREEMRKKTKDCNLYVKGFGTNIDEKVLKEAFSAYGTITSAKVMREANNTSKGFGFVCFSTKEEAAEALKNAKKVEDKDVTVAVAQPKAERQSYLAAQHRARPPFGGPYPRMGFPPLQGQYMQGAPMNRGPFPPNQFVGARPQGPTPLTLLFTELVNYLRSEHPANAPAIAAKICDSLRDTPPPYTILQNPALLQQKVAEALAAK